MVSIHGIWLVLIINVLSLFQVYNINQSIMENQHYFLNKNKLKSQQQLTKITQTDKSSEGCSSINEADFSDNQLNLGFICEDSRLISDSISVVSESLPLSEISRIRSNPAAHSPHFCRLEAEISGMEEWSMQRSISQKSHVLKDMNNSISLSSFPIQQQPEDEDEFALGNRCTKKRIGEKMKVLTIKPQLKEQKKEDRQSGYMLRSRRRNNQEEDNSSDEQILQLINQIGPRTRGNRQNKKNNIK